MAELVERWFAEPTTKELRRGAHRCVRQLNADIRAWIDTWNADLRPFVWTKTAEQILHAIARYCDRINEITTLGAVPERVVHRGRGGPEGRRRRERKEHPCI